MTLRKREDTGIWKGKLYITLSGGPALREAMDLLQERLHNKWIVKTFILYNINAAANQRKVTYKKYRPELIQDVVGNMRDKQGWNEKKGVDIWHWSVFSDQFKDVTSRTVQYTALERWGVVEEKLCFSAVPTKDTWGWHYSKLPCKCWGS